MWGWGLPEWKTSKGRRTDGPDLRSSDETGNHTEAGSNQEIEAPRVFELRGFNAGKRMHRGARAEKQNRGQHQQEAATTPRREGGGREPEARGYGHDHRAVQREPEPSGSGSCCQRLPNTDGERTPTFYGLLPLSEPNDSGNWAMQPAGETAFFPLYPVEQRKRR